MSKPVEYFLIQRDPVGREYLESFCYLDGQYKWTRDLAKAWSMTVEQINSRLYLVQVAEPLSIVVPSPVHGK